ncbi:MAG: protein kinase, partial [Pirellulales bacterium]|nr:protein kinase [Pirellulales bacterium]
MASLESNGRDSLPPPGSSGVGSSRGDAGGVELLLWLSELARGSAEDEQTDLHDGNGRAAPHSIGPFRLETLLGQGAYGAVFRAFDTELERSVALKVAWPHVMFDRISAQRFVEEPKTAAALDHSGIVKIYRSGWVDAVCYIAFELVDGPSLRQWLKAQGHVPFRVAAELIAQVAVAVQHAHEHGVVHRDLKPGNILLKPRPGNPALPFEPAVGDFGLAARARPTALSTLTGTRDVIGTDPYVAPEQLDGGKGNAQPGSDVFSLGVILYELVAGRRPFDGETAEETRSLIRNDEPPSIRTFRPTVPRDLTTIISKCLQKSPSVRYRSAKELADDLRRFLNHEPIRARRVAAWQRAWKYARRKPLVVSLVSLAAISVIAIASLFGALIANRISAAQRIEAAEAAKAVVERIERHRQYAANIRHAAESLRTAGPREAMSLLSECRSQVKESPGPGIEWHFLRSQIGNADRIIAGHDEWINVVRFSPDGKVMVSAGEDTKGVPSLWCAGTRAFFERPAAVLAGSW